MLKTPFVTTARLHNDCLSIAVSCNGCYKAIRARGPSFRGETRVLWTVPLLVSMGETLTIRYKIFPSWMHFWGFKPMSYSIYIVIQHFDYHTVVKIKKYTFHKNNNYLDLPLLFARCCWQLTRRKQSECCLLMSYVSKNPCISNEFYEGDYTFEW